jgi:hypothetical protein
MFDDRNFGSETAPYDRFSAEVLIMTRGTAACRQP